MPLIDHPMHLAAEVAKLLESDPVAAGQVKEHIKEERLCELLGLVYMPDAEEAEEMTDFALLNEVKARFTRAQVLAAFK